MIPPANLHNKIRNLDSLPAIPSIAQKILALKINTDEGERSLLNLIEKDPPLLSKIIGMANSPLLGVGREILTLHDAAALLGVKRVKMTALSLAMMSSLKRKSVGRLNIDALWKHSLSITMIMETLAGLMPKDRRPPDDETHLSGLLHDIGFLVLDYLDPSLSDQFQERLTAAPERSVEEIEAEMLEMDHCKLGAELAHYWNLPESIIAVLRHRQTPFDDRASVGLPLVAMANLAEKLLPVFRNAESSQANIVPGKWLALGIDPLHVEQVKAQALEYSKHTTELYF